MSARCPFEPSHSVAPNRLQDHIQRCRMTSENAHLFSNCKYNYTHWFRKSEAKDHYDNCKSKVDFSDGLDFLGGYTPAKLVDNTSPSVSKESWDDDTAPEFDPNIKKAKAPHMVIPEGLSKAKRKEHWKNELVRLRDMESEQLEHKEKLIEEEVLTVEPVEVNSCRKPGLGCRITARFSLMNKLPEAVPGQPSSMNKPLGIPPKEAGQLPSVSQTEQAFSRMSVGRGRGLLQVFADGNARPV